MVQDPYEPDLSNIELSILLWAYQSVIYIYAKAISGYDRLKSTSNVVTQNKKIIRGRRSLLLVEIH